MLTLLGKILTKLFCFDFWSQVSVCRGCVMHILRPYWIEPCGCFALVYLTSLFLCLNKGFFSILEYLGWSRWCFSLYSCHVEEVSSSTYPRQLSLELDYMGNIDYCLGALSSPQGSETLGSLLWGGCDVSRGSIVYSHGGSKGLNAESLWLGILCNSLNGCFWQK